MKYISPARKTILQEEGSSLLELAIILPLLVLLFAGIVDLGRAFYYSDALAQAAENGALYGSQYPTDTAGMIQAADLDAQNVPGVNATASYGCECNNGTGQSPSCSTTPTCGTNVVYYVTVTAKTAYIPMIPWPGIPSSYNLSSSVTMRSGE